MRCLRRADFQSAPCRPQAKAYLQCRMDRQLMAKEPLEKLGFKDLIDEKPEGQHQKLQ
uniref:Cytochrome c oxidase assembly factor COX19 n=1 Tax=Crocodylus porosus TaxID=8502 RepID=A0A7M4FGW9_CROPO